MAGPWCLWWDVACDDLTDEERAPCKEDGLCCSPDECPYCGKPCGKELES